ncbi:Glutamyl-Q tRNA(Asp) synthetase [Pararobbsia alpina]|uniref:tRNA glutamyl-Q(34) synthetase GluQRS n=1 Tax=Pararobbsia alpina TaxID=621374 RepID=UPI0039A5ECC7
MTGAAGYCGRFAPSPTGPLHAGSLVSALASYLDAKAHHGRWLIRVEDIDGPRTVPGAAQSILTTLERFGMHADEPPVWQTDRTDAYQHALDRLIADGQVYPCGCTRKEIADSLTDLRERHRTLAYPGTCRDGLHGKAPRAWRLRVPDGDAAIIRFNDRWQGSQQQDLATEVGDFVLKRADGQWAYQLAVVVDDGWSGITDIVRGEDLLDSTARQIYLQACLGLPAPRYLHVPVVTDANGEKLSKQTLAEAIDDEHPLVALSRAARHLGLMQSATSRSVSEFYEKAIAEWGEQRVRRA